MLFVNKFYISLLVRYGDNANLYNTVLRRMIADGVIFLSASEIS